MKDLFLVASALLGLAAGCAATSDESAADLNATTSETSYAKCKTVLFTVNGSAVNRNLSGVPLDTLEGLREAFAAAPFLNVSGPQNLAGTFCQPKVYNSNNTKLQVLFGSITVDRGGWDAQGGLGTQFPEYKPELYSWVRFANLLGYPTLALDRLGTGQSSHPDPVLVAQAPYEGALYDDLAKQIRKGSSQLGQPFNHLIYIGNSYGSQLGTGVAGSFPKAFDEFILTGYSKLVQPSFVGVLLGIASPAAVVMPDRFGKLDPGYLTEASEQGRINSFFGSHAQSDFEDEAGHLFFQRESTVSVGQFVSVYAGFFNGSGFTGRVLTLTGEQDQAFCGPGSPLLGPASCGPLLKETGELFPNADYNYKSVNRTGHAVQNFLTAQTTFTIAHQFLAGQSFAGGPPA